jgi:molecular chaperone DnaJ
VNPYEVLGVREGASKEEIRQAYLELVKKYHPDKFRDNPLSDLAEEKLKEINEAYNMLTNGGYSNGGSQNASYQRVVELVEQGQIQQAQQMLANLPSGNGPWHFCSAAIAARLGRYGEAKIHLETAMRLEPGNQTYRAAYQQMMGIMHGQRQTVFAGQNQGDDLCRICTTLYLADCCCECMGGDFISCC